MSPRATSSPICFGVMTGPNLLENLKFERRRKFPQPGASRFA
jgi:hypothetical protein